MQNELERLREENKELLRENLELSNLLKDVNTEGKNIASLTEHLEKLRVIIREKQSMIATLNNEVYTQTQSYRDDIHKRIEFTPPYLIEDDHNYEIVDKEYKWKKHNLFLLCGELFDLSEQAFVEKVMGDIVIRNAKFMPFYMMLLLDHLDMIIDKKVGNPYKKGLAKCREIVIGAFEEIGQYIPISLAASNIKGKYIERKMEIIRLRYELEEYKERKAEERKAILQAQREELAAQREIEREIKRAQKDEQEAQAKLQKRQMELAQAKSDAEIARLKEYIERLQAAVKEAQQRHERALSMAQQTRAGYVYIISNIGSFGEGVYKIGMTRRVEPMERVVELSNASVPFPYDVHAMIWSEDAPTLESSLHRIFDNRKVNAINGRKEFFQVSLAEVSAELERMGIDTYIVEYPTAAQYRDTQRMRSDLQ